MSSSGGLCGYRQPPRPTPTNSWRFSSPWGLLAQTRQGWEDLLAMGGRSHCGGGGGHGGVVPGG
eukprot:5667383-Pyramimonas_sp.AAC.1